ncbi:MAG: hypothetical protein KA135_08285 [Halioglobus sp.]|nr:hypothetical protein [Halioglobus sp.]
MNVVPNEVLTAVALYVLLRCSVYLWYRSRRLRGNESPDDVPASGTDAGADSAGRRRVASGIHLTENRKRAFVKMAMALATLTLAGLALSSIGGQGAGP